MSQVGCLLEGPTEALEMDDVLKLQRCSYAPGSGHTFQSF